MKLKFNNEIYGVDLESCSSGLPKEYNYHLELDENGDEYLVSEEYDLQSIIDSYESACSIERIIISHGLGDELIMNKKSGVYLSEDEVNAYKNASSYDNLNTQLLSLYKDYSWMKYEDFANAVLHGDFDKLKKPVEDNGGFE